MCSVIGDQLSSFNDEHIELANITASKPSCPVLLLSECSPQSYFAVFVRKLDTSKRYGLKVFHRNDFIEYVPIDDDFSATITVNGNETVSVGEVGVDVAGIKCVY